MTYSFRDSIHRFDDSAITPEIAGKELERIYDKHGALRAQIVVDEARPDDAPLHPAFEWDDLVAAEYYRREQARSLIKTVQVVREDESDETKKRTCLCQRWHQGIKLSADFQGSQYPGHV
jgi:hypothetical protein